MQKGHGREVRLVILDVRSAHNVGAMFRTAEAAGVSKVYLVGYTPAPIDRFGRPQAEIEKTALGAETMVPWEQVEFIDSLVEQLRYEKVRIVALEQDARARDYKECDVTGPTALIVGNEVGGVPKEVLDQADDIIAIPMKGRKESLNVSVATGIALFRLLDR